MSYVQGDEPVSPILGPRQSTLSYDNSKREDTRPGMPSRSNSNLRQESTVSSPPRTTLHDTSPIPGMKTPGPPFATKRKVMDPNGIGSTGATALGMGGPSDWESYDHGEYEVDDLELYATKQEQKMAAQAAEEAHNGAPVELPAGSPVLGRVQQNWRNSAAIEMDSGSPIAVRPTSLPPQAQQSYGAAVAGKVVDAGIIKSTAPIQAGPTQHTGQQEQPLILPGSLPQAPLQQGSIPGGYPPALQSHQTQIASAAPQNNAYVIDNGSGWHQSQGHQQQYAAPQQSHQPTDHASYPLQQVIPPLSINEPVGQMIGPPGVIGNPSLSPHAVGPPDMEFQILQRKLTQTESELAQFKDREMEHRLHGEQSTEEVQRLKDRIAKLEDECRGAQSEYAKLERSVEIMENASVTAANEKAKIEGEKSKIETEKSKIEGEKAVIESERTALLAEKARWDTERTDLASKIGEAEAALSKTKAEMEGTRSDLLAKVTAADAALTIVKSDAEATSTGYQAKLKEAEDAVAQAKSEIEVAKKQLEDHKAQPVDIAPGLGDWYKGSLARFLATLFAEEAGVSVPDKMKKFQDWVNAEAQLRGIEMHFGPKPDTRAAPVFVGAQRGPSPARLKTAQSDVSALTDDEEYSPGGRPIMRRAVTEKKNVSDVSITSQEVVPPVPVTQSDTKTSPAFQPFRAYRAESVTPQPLDAARSNSIPGLTKPNASVVEPPAPPKSLAYQKPKYVKPLDPLQRSTVSAPILPPQARASSIKPPDEIFLPDFSDTAKPKVPEVPITDDTLPAPLKPKTPAPFAQSSTQSKTPAPPKTTATIPAPTRKSSNLPPLEQLQDLLPRVAMPSLPLSHPKINPVNNALSRFSDSDFSFIPSIITQWEASAAETRKRLDTQRARREAEAEEHTSQLFQDGAIGYGDIGEMEGTNKEKELEIQEKETQAEWDSYLKDVFGTVFGRLQKEIEELINVRADVDVLCQVGAAGQRALDASSRPDALDRAVSLADALGLLIRTHILLGARDTEMDKAVVDRDRRYKKNITRGLYRKGQIKKMKEQELHFERLEKRANVDRRRERLKNCNLLMKEVKTAVGRGCDENEAFAKDVIAAVRRVALDEALDSRKTEVQSAVRRASDVLSELSQSSTSLMRLYERVDDLLNDAEYEHQIAVERASDAEQAVFHELEVQKKENDVLLKQEAAQREAAVDKTLQEWRAEMTKITAAMGLDTADVDDEEADKKKRLQAALENAKRRNGDL